MILINTLSKLNNIGSIMNMSCEISNGRIIKNENNKHIP